MQFKKSYKKNSEESIAERKSIIKREAGRKHKLKKNLQKLLKEEGYGNTEFANFIPEETSQKQARRRQKTNPFAKLGDNKETKELEEKKAQRELEVNERKEKKL